MILLSGHSLTKVRSVPLESMSLQLKERDSTATISAENLDGIGVDSWLLDDREPGAGIVWRVKSIQNAMSKRTVTVNLEHAISTLRDNILFGEITPAMMSGRLGATTCTAQEAIEYILDRQNDWVLGTFDYSSVSNPYKFDGDSLFDAIETVTSSLTDAWWSYDFTVYPFKLNITAKQAGTDSILRPGRNLRTISRTVDKSGMYTRFYPIGKNDLHIDTGYVEKNVNLYGVVSHVETDQSIDSKAELTRWANERLAVHAEPVVTVDVEGLELAAETGESMDKLTLGRICEIPLPEFGMTISERITALNYPDKIAQPEMVRITLANNRQDVTKIISDAMKRSGKGSRTSSRQGKEDLAWFEDTNDHVAMVAKGIVGVDAQGNPNWIRLSEIVVSGEGIDASVQSIQNDMVIQEGRIDVTESKVGMTVKTNDTRPVKSYSSASQFPATGSSSYLYLDNSTGKYYEWKNGAYSETVPLGIKAAEICVAINNSGDTTANISADHVNISATNTVHTLAGEIEYDNQGRLVIKNAGGMYVKRTSQGTTSYFGVWDDGNISSGMVVSKINGQTSATIKADKIDIQGIVNELISYDVAAESLSAHQITSDGECTFDTIVVDSLQVNGYTNVLVEASVSGNTLTLTYDDGSTVTFNKAATPTLSGSWSSGTLTVSSTPAAAANYTVGFGGSYGDHSVELEVVTNGNATKDSIVANTIDVPIKVGSLNNGSASTQRYTKSLAVSVSGLLDSKTATANGSVTPGDGKIGLSKVTVNVPYAMTDYTVFTADMGAVSGYTKDASYNYYVKNGTSGSNIDIRVYTYAHVTVDGNVINSAAAGQYDWLGVVPTAIYKSGYAQGIIDGRGGSWNTSNAKYEFTKSQSGAIASIGSPWFFYTSTRGTSNWLLDRSAGPYLKIATSQSGAAFQDETWEIPEAGTAGTISLPEASMNTSSNPSSTYSRITKLGKMAKNAYADYDWVIFRINCTCGATKYVAFDPHQS